MVNYGIFHRRYMYNQTSFVNKINYSFNLKINKIIENKLKKYFFTQYLDLIPQCCNAERPT